MCRHVGTASWPHSDMIVMLPAVATSAPVLRLDRKSTRLNSSHMSISYAVFCLKKKNPQHQHRAVPRLRLALYPTADFEPVRVLQHQIPHDPRRLLVTVLP